MKKRSMMLVTSMMLAVLLIAGGTFAWFTATAGPVVNEFEVGTLEIELVDEFCPPTNVNPGDCYEKVVYVENTGSKCAFVRVDMEMAFGHTGLPTDVVTYELGDKWVEHNGYFYYIEQLAAEGGRTTDLFAFMPCEEPCGEEMSTMFFGKITCPICGEKYWPLLGHNCPGPDPDEPDPDPDEPDPDPIACGGHICFDGPSMGNEYQGAVFTITINAEAIQCSNGAALDEWGVDPTTLGDV